jgi:N-acetylglucosaminyldiphosphoundecaprenol N-acetyl-beta-D-mannosaminyltransferase
MIAWVRRQRLFGLEFICGSDVRTVGEALLHDARAPTGHWRSVVTPNVDHLVRYSRHPAERRVAESAHFVLADGMPVVWASTWLRRPLGDRIAGSDLFAYLWRRLMEERRPILVIAGNDEVVRRLRDEYPAAAFIVPPIFRVDDDAAVDALVSEIHARISADPVEFVMIGMSMPKHHLLAARLSALPTPEQGGPVLLLFGASAELYVGLQRRAPVWMQRHGLEWLFRLVQNPRQMAKRYLVDDLAFLGIVWRERRRSSGSNRQ